MLGGDGGQQFSLARPAERLEAAVDDVFHPSAEDSKAYADKVRSLAANLRQNERLRRKVLSRATNADELVKMTVIELATDDQKEQRIHVLQTAIDERIVTEAVPPPIKEPERA